MKLMTFAVGITIGFVIGVLTAASQPPPEELVMRHRTSPSWRR